MTDISNIVSMPANAEWWKFFKAAYFGSNYFAFRGRASRKEFWSVLLSGLVLNFLISAVIITILTFAGLDFIKSYPWILLAHKFYFLFPILGLMVRRFHDINMRGWQAIFVILALNINFKGAYTLIWALGLIFLAILPFFKGDRKDNRFGKNIYSDN